MSRGVGHPQEREGAGGRVLPRAPGQERGPAATWILAQGAFKPTGLQDDSLRGFAKRVPAARENECSQGLRGGLPEAWAHFPSSPQAAPSDFPGPSARTGCRPFSQACHTLFLKAQPPG